MPVTMLDAVSVVIPTQNDPLTAIVIMSVQKELGDRCETIVVGRDDTHSLQQLPGIHFIDTGRRVGASHARNIGIAASSGQWLFFVDSDCIVQPGWAMALAGRMAGGAKVVSGSVTFPAANYWQLVYNISMFHEFMPHLPPSTRPFLPTLNLAVHRDVIHAVGGMDEQLARGQDVDWTIRMAMAGYDLFFEPRAAVSHHPQRSDFGTVWRYWQRSGYYNIRNRLRYADYLHTPRLMRSPPALRILAPLIAAYVTAGLFARSPHLLRYAQTVPAIYLTKVAWCLGAASGISNFGGSYEAS